MKQIHHILRKSFAIGTILAMVITAIPLTSLAQTGTGGGASGSGPCVPGTTSGNIFGYLTTETIGNIYLSTESWNYYEPNQTTVEFFVTYDRQNNLWGGRGWNQLVGWVDFGLQNTSNIGSRRAEFVSITGNPAYGNWWPFIEGLGNVTYQQDPGTFVGTARNQKLTINNASSSVDHYVGAGNIGFSNVEYRTELNPCNEHVNIFINGVSTLYKKTCPITTPKITWSSSNVANCQTDAGLWQNPGTRPVQNTLGENASGAITTANSPVIFRLKCTGIDSQTTIYGTANASCGPLVTQNPCVTDPWGAACQTWCQLNPTHAICTDPDPGTYCERFPSDPICSNPTGGGGTGGPIDPSSGMIIPDFKEV